MLKVATYDPALLYLIGLSLYLISLYALYKLLFFCIYSSFSDYEILAMRKACTCNIGLIELFL